MTIEALRSSLEDGLGRIILDHPPLNIHNLELLRQLHGELDRLADAPELRVLLLSAAGRRSGSGFSRRRWCWSPGA